MTRMTPKQIEAMNKKRYGRRGKKPSAKELEAALRRQSPDPSNFAHPDDYSRAKGDFEKGN